MNQFGTENWVKVSPDNHTYRRDYYVSNYGRVVSKGKEKGDENLMNLSLNKRNGFYYVAVVDHTGKKRGRLIQTLVAEHFPIRKPSEDAEFLTHKDGNRANNQLYNLKYITREELMNRTFRDESKRVKGKRSYTKLSLSDVKRIKLQLKRGNIRKAKLARMFGVSETQIRRIETGENWGSVEV